MGILLTFLRFAWPYLLGAALVGGAYFYAWNRGVQHERVNTVAAKKEYADYKTEQQRIVTETTLQWDAKRQEADALEVQLQRARNETFTALADRANSVTGPRVVLHRDAVRLLVDSSRAANAARVTDGDQESAAPVSDAATSDATSEASYDPAELARFFVASAAAYADAFGKWLSCVNFYESLRSEQ